MSSPDAPAASGAGTNPIRKSSRWLRVMSRPRRPRRARQLRGLTSKTKARSSSAQPATHSPGSGQPRQAMLGAAAGRGCTLLGDGPGPHSGNPRGWGPSSVRGRAERPGPAPPVALPSDPPLRCQRLGASRDGLYRLGAGQEQARICSNPGPPATVVGILEEGATTHSGPRSQVPPSDGNPQIPKLYELEGN